jgi:GNAT superfamily N-acetyltransferase
MVPLLFWSTRKRFSNLIDCKMAEPTKTQTVSIRRATLADAPQLAPLAGQLGYASTAEQVAARLREILRDANHIVLVAEDKGEISGYIEAFPLRTVTCNPRVEIGGLIVDESCRGQGVGRLLMARVEEWACANGYKEARLRSNVVREAAHRFYENLGYRINKTQKSFLKTL